MREALLRATAELYTRASPLRVVKVSGDFIKVKFECHDAHRVGIRLAENGTQSGNLLTSREGQLLAKDLDIALNPALANLLNLDKLGHSDWPFVREVKAKLCSSHEGALLVDVVAEDVFEAKVENVSSSVVAANRSSPCLRS